MRTVVAELVPNEALQPKAFAFLPTAAGLGTILGPVVGGSLAHAADRYANLFGGSPMLLSYPFALPVIVSAVLFGIAFVLALVALQETGSKAKAYSLVAQADDGENDVPEAIDLNKYPQQNENDTVSSQEGVADHRDGKKPFSKLHHFRNATIWMNAVCGLHSIAFDQMLPVFLHHNNDRSRYRSILEFSFGMGKGRCTKPSFSRRRY